MKLYFKNLLFSLRPSEENIKKADKIRYSCYMIPLLVPFLQELCQEQMLEKEIEAKIQDKLRALTEWKANSNGSLTCLLKEIGGCGSSLLELKCIFSESWLSDLREKAEALLERYDFVKLPDMSTHCTCFNSSNWVDCESEKIRKAACRVESDDNYIYCPDAEEIQQEELEHFQQHWFKGQPVIIRNVLNFTLGLSWEPKIILHALHERSKIKDESNLFAVKAIDCLNWSQAGMHIYRFFRGYTKGWIDNS